MTEIPEAGPPFRVRLILKIKVAASSVEGRFQLRSPGIDDGDRLRFRDAADDRDASLENTGLLARNPGDVLAKELGMIVGDLCDHAG